MSFQTFIQHALTGVSLGGAYGLIAIGYTMVYGILLLINFAHADIFMMAGYFMIFAIATFPWPVAIPLVILLTVLLGVLIEKLAYRPLRDAPRMSIMISAIAVSYFLQNLATFLFSALPQAYPTIAPLKQSVSIGGVNASLVTLITPGLTIVLVLVLLLLLHRTKFGMAMRAVSKDYATSKLMGIKINQVISLTFVIGSALAAIGSILYFTDRMSVTPFSGMMPGLKCFVAAVLGGIGSIPGAVIGGFIIGIAETFLIAFGYSTYSDAVTFLLLIAILIFKPSGLLGEPVTEKV